MPYIITTHKPTGQIVAEGTVCTVAARTAVATLTEARDACRATVEPLFPAGTVVPMDGGEWAEAGTPTAVYHDLHFAVDSLPESGGTIGPLPDGTVIEVREITWKAIYQAIGREASYYEWEPEWDDHDHVLAVYNKSKENA